MYIRKCPICGGDINYKAKNKFKIAEEKNARCIKCSNYGRKLSNESKHKISKTLKGKYKIGELSRDLSYLHNDAIHLKISQSKKGIKLSKYHKEQISKGINNSEKFKLSVKNTDRNLKISKALKNKPKSIEHRKKLSQNHVDISGNKNPSKRPDVRKKLRLATINNIKKYSKDRKINPNYNPVACKYFNNLMKEHKIFIQHAENYGEYYIKGLGYFVDGYDKENNIVYEYDERAHFKLDKLKESDVVRQQEIMNFLKCKFIRIKYDGSVETFEM